MGVTVRGLIARRRFVLDVPTFEADRGGTARLGANGAGKTMLLIALHGLIPASGSGQRDARTTSEFTCSSESGSCSRRHSSLVTTRRFGATSFSD